MTMPASASTADCRITMRQNIGPLCAERHADPDLLRSLRDAVGDHAVDAHGREHEGGARENRQHQHRQAPLRDGLLDDLVQRLDVGDGEVRVLLADDAADRR